MSFSAANLPPIPPSPTRSFASTTLLTTPSIRSPPPPPLPKHFLTRGDVAGCIEAYENLAEAAKLYRKALTTAATAASAFGEAFEQCARCKASGDTASGLMNAGGLQYLISSNLNILAQTLHRGFEGALLHEVDRYKEKNAENEKRYAEEVEQQEKELRRREQAHTRISRQKSRNLGAFRSSLVGLTEQIDILESLKYGHCRAAFDLSQDSAAHVLESSALVVRAEVEVFERIAQKGWDSSGGLDDLIAMSPDPFGINFGASDSANGLLFSILPSESILPAHPTRMSRSASASGGNNERKYHSLTDTLLPDENMDDLDEEDGQSIFSSGFRSPTLKPSRAIFHPDATGSEGWGIDDEQRSINDSETDGGRESHDIGRMNGNESSAGSDMTIRLNS
ncbi:hypothetical protein EX30DRAFT_339628 [Ascodesmis nigricans]|uniref:IMD domain-containing protein n=1 Tax=Ascodesmis nigricans TaxID=341454 RepID=A0A4S2N019_9PEZI|nr:hypothetical protein EX30DRAFT_339628 [Ascodesmis nigricans]